MSEYEKSMYSINDHKDTKKIDELIFHLISANEARKISVVEIFKENLGKDKKDPFIENGLFDLRMGTLENDYLCQTCQGSLDTCPGHFGRIELATPVLHLGLINELIDVLKCICVNCSRLLIDPKSKQHKKDYKKLMNIKDPEHRIKELIKRTTKMKFCSFKSEFGNKGCGFQIPTIKLVDNYKITFEFKNLDPTKDKKEISILKPTVKQINKILKRIDVRDYEMLGFDEKYSKPESLTIEVLLVPPPHLRPTNKSNAAAKGEDDATHKLADIIKHNNNVKKFIDIYKKQKYSNSNTKSNSLSITNFNSNQKNKSNENLNEDVNNNSKTNGNGSNQPNKKRKLNFGESITPEEVFKPFKNNSGRSDIQKSIDESSALLQTHISSYFDSDKPGSQNNVGKMGKQTKGFVQKIKGKEGRVRENLMGKRVDFSARTVISPDPNLSIHQTAVPHSIAKILTFPEIVSQYNIKEMIECVKRGPFEYNGANFVILKNGMRINLKNFSYDKIVEKYGEIQYGMKVERHMRTGDIGTLNRQPSLHKPSIMGMRMVVMPYSTFRINPTVTPPYNADFDGDEMNLGFPQTQAARAEIEELMSVPKCIISSENNKPCMGIVQDGLVGNFLLTQRDVFFDRSEFQDIIGFTKIYGEKDSIPSPSIFKPKELWTGKQVFGFILPRINYRGTTNHHDESRFYKNESNMREEFEKYISEKRFQNNLDAKDDFESMLSEMQLDREKILFERRFMQSKKMRRDLNEDDTMVLIRDGELIYGNICKKTIGSTANSLIHIVTLDLGTERIHKFMDDCQIIGNKFLTKRALTIGMRDIESHKDNKDRMNKIISEANQKIEMWKKEGLSKLAFESRVNKLLNEARGKAAEDTMLELSKDNNFMVIINAGSKGTSLNPAQMTRCVGQQNIEGKRIPSGWDNDRSLPHFKPGDVSPIARGFVGSCYTKGLRPEETWFHAMAGREGLIDTAIKTAETGYLQRRLCKAQEDICISYDKTVRDSTGSIIQFSYGEDGIDSIYQEWQILPYINQKRERYENNVFWPRLNTLYEKLKNMDSSKDNDSDESKKERKNILKDIYDLEECIRENGMELLERERSRLEKDIILSKDFLAQKTVQPVNMKRLLKNFMMKNKDEKVKESVSIKKIIKDVINLQEEMWKNLPLETNRWDSNFAILIRYHLCSKNIKKKNFTKKIWEELLKEIKYKHAKSIAVPGECVGTISGQSIGGPATQMTLNTFHFIGISEKNVQLGVPRIKELVNALKNIKTPSMAIYLKDHLESNKELVEWVAKSLEMIHMEDIILKKEVILEEDYYSSEIDPEIVEIFSSINENREDIEKYEKYVIRFLFDKKKMKENEITILDIVKIISEYNVYLEYSDEDCEECILRCRCISDTNMKTENTENIEEENMGVAKEMSKILSSIQNIKGVPNIKKTYVKQYEDKITKKNKWYIETDGTNIQKLFENEFIDFSRLYCNDPQKTLNIFGAEASRECLNRELITVLSGWGGYVNKRHIGLMADVMLQKGTIMKMTRHGINRRDEVGPLVKASFEETSEIFHKASRFSYKDELKGVTESVMLGSLVPIGTGMVDIFLDHNKLIQT